MHGADLPSVYKKSYNLDNTIFCMDAIREVSKPCELVNDQGCSVEQERCSLCSLAQESLHELCKVDRCALRKRLSQLAVAILQCGGEAVTCFAPGTRIYDTEQPGMSMESNSIDYYIEEKDWIYFMNTLTHLYIISPSV